MTSAEEPSRAVDAPEAGFRPLRAIITGALLVPLNLYFLMYMEVGFNQGLAGTGAGPYPSTVSLFANCVSLLLALVVANSWLSLKAPKLSLARSELLIVYVMATVATSIVSIDFLDVLVPMMTYPFYAATPENQWRQVLWPHLPTWACVSDPEAVQAWYHGRSSIFQWSIARHWVVPGLVWSGVIFVMLAVMFAINTLVRERWMSEDRLAFPIVELPMQLTEPGMRLLRSRLMWAGFCISAAISIVNGLHVYFPLMPSVQVRMWDLAPLFSARPYNAIGWTPISLYPYGIGLGFMLPLDMLFSCWFFYVLWRVIRVLGAVYGAYDTHPQFPFMNQQALGAYLIIGLMALWTGRKHLAGVLGCAVRGEKGDDDPMSYRSAALVVAAGVAGLSVFFHLLGIRWWLAAAATLLYFLLSLAIARMHAEFGPPAHDLHSTGPDVVLTDMLGTSSMGRGELAGFAWFWWFNRAYRSIPIAYQLDGMKIASRSATPQRTMAWAVACSSVLAVAFGFLFYLHYGYTKGAAVGLPGHVPHFGFEAFGYHFDRWVKTPEGPDGASTGAIGIGAAAAWGMYMLKLRFSWWPFHPLGFAVSTSYSIGTLWFPMFIAWAAKLLTLRAGGLRSYRVALDFFLGLLLGDFVMGCFWPLAGMVLRIPTYSFMQ